MCSRGGFPTPPPLLPGPGTSLAGHAWLLYVRTRWLKTTEANQKAANTHFRFLRCDQARITHKVHFYDRSPSLVMCLLPWYRYPRFAIIDDHHISQVLNTGVAFTALHRFVNGQATGKVPLAEGSTRPAV